MLCKRRAPTGATKDRLTATAVCVGGVGVALWVLGWRHPNLLGVWLILPPPLRVVVWTHPILSGVVAALSLANAAVGAWLFRVAIRDASVPVRVRLLAPLSFLPLAMAPFFAGPHLPHAVAANVLFYGSVLVLSFVLYQIMQHWDTRRPVSPVTSRQSVIVGVVASLFFFLVGWYFTAMVGAHSGDEGHYIVQAESLYHDHDLDLRNNIGEASPERRMQQHVSPLSRDGHYYSWHPFGLSLLIAPAVPGGVPARHLVLGLLSGLCCAGVWELCRAFRAQAHWSLLVLLLFALSTLWGVYSSRCLPEVAGAAMTVWGVVGILRQRDRPWGSMLGTLACCAGLPWLHTRFIPLTPAIAGLYGLFGLFGPEPWGRRIVRLAVFTGLFALASSYFWSVQVSLFATGLPHATNRGILLTYPPGIWHDFASTIGITSSLLMTPWLMAAALVGFWALPKARFATAVALSLMGVVFITTCGTYYYPCGAAVPGRYLVVVIPLFVPVAAAMLPRARPLARWWLMALGVVSCFQFVLLLARLREYFKSFVTVWDASGTVYALLRGLSQPFLSPNESLWHPAILALFVGTLLLLVLDSRRRWLATAVLAATLAAAGWATVRNVPPVTGDPRTNASRLAALDSLLARAAVTASGCATRRALFDVCNAYPGQDVSGVTTEDLGMRRKGGVVSQPRVDQNDWAGRTLRWTTLAPPTVGKGLRTVRITGDVIGAADVWWAVREGSVTLFESRLAKSGQKTFAETADVTCQGRGNVAVLVRIEGTESCLTNLTLALTPYSRRLLDAANLGR